MKIGKAAIRNSIPALIAIAIAAFFLHRFTAPPDYSAGRLGEFKSWDSGIFPGVASRHGQWLDDDTIVYQGYMGGKPRTSAEARDRKLVIIVWHLGDPPVAYDDDRWEKMGGEQYICASDGKLVYPVGRSMQADGKPLMTIAEGPPGHMQERTIEDPHRALEDRSRPDQIHDSRVCDFFHDDRMAGHDWTVDHDRKFYLDFGPSIVLRKPDNIEEAVPLDIPRDGVKAVCTNYHRFDHNFYIEPCLIGSDNLSEQKPCRAYWTVSTDTQTAEKHCIPFDAKLSRLYLTLVPTSRGVFLTTPQGGTLNDPGRSGLYAPDAKSGRYVQAIAGFIERPSISPNGCRLAFPYAKTVQDVSSPVFGRYTYTVIDVCEGRSK